MISAYDIRRSQFRSQLHACLPKRTCQHASRSAQWTRSIAQSALLWRLGEAMFLAHQYYSFGKRTITTLFRWQSGLGCHLCCGSYTRRVAQTRSTAPSCFCLKINSLGVPDLSLSDVVVKRPFRLSLTGFHFWALFFFGCFLDVFCVRDQETLFVCVTNIFSGYHRNVVGFDSLWSNVSRFLLILDLIQLAFDCTLGLCFQGVRRLRTKSPLISDLRSQFSDFGIET